MTRCILFLWLVMILSASALSASAPPRGCTATTSEEEHSGDSAPHVQENDGDRQCHGEVGDAGACLVNDDSGDDTAGVTCIENQFTGQALGCIGFAECGPGQSLSCGGTGWEANAGIDHKTGKAYAICGRGNNVTHVSC